MPPFPVIFPGKISFTPPAKSLLRAMNGGGLMVPIPSLDGRKYAKQGLKGFGCGSESHEPDILA